MGSKEATIWDEVHDMGLLAKTMKGDQHRKKQTGQELKRERGGGVKVGVKRKLGSRRRAT